MLLFPSLSGPTRTLCTLCPSKPPSRNTPWRWGWNLQEALAECYGPISAAKMRLLIEYKFFEPAFYHTDIPDWGTAYVLALQAR